MPPKFITIGSDDRSLISHALFQALSSWKESAAYLRSLERPGYDLLADTLELQSESAQRLGDLFQDSSQVTVRVEIREEEIEEEELLGNDVCDTCMRSGVQIVSTTDDGSTICEECEDLFSAGNEN